MAGGDRLVRERVEADAAARLEVVEEVDQALVEQRQPVLHARERPAGGDRFEQGIAGDGAKTPEVAGAKALDGRIVEHDLADRPELDPGNLAERALGQGIEGPDRLQDVAEQIEPERLRAAGREDVDDAAADRVFAGLDHRAAAPVAVAREAGEQGCAIDPAARLGREPAGDDQLGWRQLLEEGVDGGDHQLRPRRVLVEEAGERIQAPCHDVGIGRDPVVGQAVPGGQGHDLERRRKEAHELGEQGRPPTVARDVQQLGPGGVTCEPERVQPRGRGRHQALPGAHGQRLGLSIRGRLDEERSRWHRGGRRSVLSAREPEGPQALEQVVVVAGWHRRPTGDPVEQVLIGLA